MAKENVARKLSKSQLEAMAGRPITTQRGGIYQRLMSGVVGIDDKGCYIEGNGQKRNVLLRLRGYERVTIDKRDYRLDYAS